MKIFVNMGTVWDRATEFLSDNLSAVVPIALLTIFLPMSINANIAPLAKQSPGAAIAVNLASLIGSAVSLWGQLAIVALAIEPFAERREVLQTAARRVLPMIGVGLLITIGALALILPIPIVLGLSGYDMQAAMNGDEVEMSTALGLFVSVYVLLLVPLFLWLAARLALVTPVVLRERRGAGALRRSLVLTRGLVWKIVGVMILFSIVFGVAVLAARTVFGSILQLVAGGEGDITVASVLTSVLVGTVTTGFILLATAFTAKLYLAVRDAREAIVDSA